MSSDLVCRADKPAANTTQVEHQSSGTYTEMASRMFWESIESAREWLGWGSASGRAVDNGPKVALPGLTVGDTADETDKVTIGQNSTTYKAYEHARAATVRLTQTGGSGFFVDKEGTIVTASHAVPYGTSVTRIRMADGREHDANFVSRDSNNDLAVLKVVKTARGQEFPFLKVDANDAYGENLAAIGHPRSWPSVYLSLGKATNGPVDPNHAMWRRSDAVIRVDAHVEPGNSGGPVIDGCGSARAVTVGQAGDGITYAIPGRAVQNLLKWTEDQAAGRFYKQDGLSLGSSELNRFGAGSKDFPGKLGELPDGWFERKTQPKDVDPKWEKKSEPKLELPKSKPPLYNGPMFQSPYEPIFKSNQRLQQMPKRSPQAYDSGAPNYYDSKRTEPNYRNNQPPRWQGSTLGR